MCTCLGPGLGGLILTSSFVLTSGVFLANLICMLLQKHVAADTNTPIILSGVILIHLFN